MVLSEVRIAFTVFPMVSMLVSTVVIRLDMVFLEFMVEIVDVDFWLSSSLSIFAFSWSFCRLVPKVETEASSRVTLFPNVNISAVFAES